MEDNTVKATKKKSLYSRITEQITGVFLPIISYLTAASILKSVIILLGNFDVIDTAGGVYKIFYAVSDGFFFFLPFFLAITAAKQWKADPFIALLIPVAMLYPDLTAILENGRELSFAGLKVLPAIYHSSVFPILLAVGLLKFVEIPCDKYIPEAVKGFLKPIVCCLIVLPVTFLVFGPVGTAVGDFLTNIFSFIYERNAILAGAFMGFFIQPMVALGVHWSIVPVSIAAIANNGFDVIMPLLGGAVYSQSGACLAYALFTKAKERKRIGYQASFSCAIGVTEPALFGVTVANIRVMIAACIGGAVGGAIVGFAGTHCTSFAFPSFVTCVAYVGPGFVEFLFSMVAGFIVGFVLTACQKKWLQSLD
ncbi:MAG: PTS transporter subunit EIIC [Lachnospiraceae bacterium]|nr:PTS transporter subunit EIIC [Lachnospiraceae bacterium]